MSTRQQRKEREKQYGPVLALLKLMYPNRRLPMTRSLKKAGPRLRAAIKAAHRWSGIVEKELQEKRVEKRLSTPLAVGETVRIDDLDVIVLTAGRKGLVSDIIRESGHVPDFPEVEWKTKTSRVETGGYKSLEATFLRFLRKGGYHLPIGFETPIIRHFGIGAEFGNSDEEEVLTRTAHVFVSDAALHYYGGSLTTTTLNSEYGEGTRVYLRSPTQTA